MAHRVFAVLGDPQHSSTPIMDVFAGFLHKGGEHPKILREPRPISPIEVVVATGKTPPVSTWQDRDGSFCVIDGEIFNVPEFATSPTAHPAEAVLKLIMREGADGLAKIDAAAAMLIWDAPHGELLLARDRVGCVPVLTAAHQGRFYVASNVFSLIAAGIDRTVDARTLDFFIGHGFAPPPWTFLKAVSKLPCGHLLRIKPGGVASITRYDWSSTATRRAAAPAEHNSGIERLLMQSIERRRAPQAKTAVLLSGGVDSALVLACLTKFTDTEPVAFTFQYGGYDGVFNEAPVAKRIANHLGVAHHVVPIAPEDLKSRIPGLVHDYGEPFTYGLHSFAMEKLRSAGVGVALTGSGSDAFSVDRSGFFSIWFNRLPRLLQRAAELGVTCLKSLVPELDKRSVAILWSSRHSLPSSLYPPNMREEERRKLFGTSGWYDEARRETLESMRAAVAQWGGGTNIDIWLLVAQYYFDAECMMMWNSAWARRNGIALRFPFLDKAFREYMFQMSSHGRGKRFVREIAATMMPPEYARMPKVPQTIPIGQWLRGPLQETMRSYLAKSRVSAYFDPAAVDRLIAEHQSGKRDRTWVLWSLMTVIAWSEALQSVPVIEGANSAGREPVLATSP